MLANKLKGSHIDFYKQKMKVNLATQTISNSVATAIDFCRDELKLSQFAGSEETSRFLILFDRLFDIFDSKSYMGNLSKAPMSVDNIREIKVFFEYATLYIKKITTSDGKSILKSQRKTAFIGYLGNMKALLIIFDRLVLTGKLSKILTYKMSQDHIELFFWQH